MFGAICGDILGSTVEFDEIKYHDIEKIRLCLDTDHITDDSALTFAVADWLLHDIKSCCDNDEELKKRLAKRFVQYSFYTFDNIQLGFGSSFRQWCCKADLLQEYAPYNSYGNGSGMRVSPVGWFFDTLEETLHFAKLSADVTHNHPEGEKGAMCIAAAVYLARTGQSKEDIRSALYQAFGYEQLRKSVAEIRENCSWSEICQDTVPMAVVAFLESDDFETAVKLAISYGSDSDTIAAMAGSIAGAYYGGIPQKIADFCRMKIPDSQLVMLNEFYDTVKGDSGYTQNNSYTGFFGK